MAIKPELAMGNPEHAARTVLESACESQPDPVITIDRYVQDVAVHHHLLETIIHSTVDGICVADVAGNIVLQNTAMRAITGQDHAGLVASVAADCGFYGLDQVTLLKAEELPCRRAIRGERVRNQELYLRNARRPEGLWLRVNATTFCNEAGALVGAVAVYRDATAEKRAAAARARLAKIIQTSAAALAVVKLDGTILDWNQGAEQLLGYRAAEVVGRSIKIALQPDRAEDFERAKAELLRGAPVYNYETVRVHRDGTLIDVAMTVAPIANRAGRIVSLYGIMTDIRDRRRREHYLAELANNERQKLGRDLHDTLGQQLTGIALLTNALKDRLLKKSSAADVLARLETAVEDAKIQIRNILQGLSPVDLDSRGLVVALEELAHKASIEHRVDCRLDCAEALTVADNFVATQFYYIAREGVHNALVHAQPRKIEIRLTNTDGLRLSVLDDGCGLSAEAGSTGGMGLHIMRYRSDLIGATLHLESHSAGGTWVACHLPVTRVRT